jgi:hypothetical protein
MLPPAISLGPGPAVVVLRCGDFSRRPGPEPEADHPVSVPRPTKSPLYAPSDDIPRPGFSGRRRSRLKRRATPPSAPPPSVLAAPKSFRHRRLRAGGGPPTPLRRRPGPDRSSLRRYPSAPLSGRPAEGLGAGPLGNRGGDRPFMRLGGPIRRKKIKKYYYYSRKCCKIGSAREVSQ